MSRKIAYIAFIISWLFLLSIVALSHSWYDPECCSGQDCAIALEINMATKMVRTPLGSAPMDAQTKIKDSKDSKTHACIRQGKVICLYLPPQS